MGAVQLHHRPADRLRRNSLHHSIFQKVGARRHGLALLYGHCFSTKLPPTPPLGITYVSIPVNDGHAHLREASADLINRSLGRTPAEG